MKKSQKNIVILEMGSDISDLKNFHIRTSMVDYDFSNTPGINLSKNIVLVKIEGRNMEPTIFPQEVVICQKVQKFIFEPKESAAVIISKKGIMVRRLYKHLSNNYFYLVNDNPLIENFEEIDRGEIFQLLIIYGKLFPGLIFKYIHQKLNEMEESLELLKMETSRIRKELKKL